jgi:uncharacterized repeat protein (TIGR01451 family)
MDDDQLRIDDRRRRAAVFVVVLLLSLVPALVTSSAPAATAGTQIAAPTDADIWIDASGAALPQLVGQRGSLAYVVGNAGPAPATGVTATFEIPAGLTAASPTGPCLATESGQTCSADLGSRSPGQAPRSSITVWADAPGAYTIRATATADQPDPAPANNADTVTVLVLPDADVSVQVTESADPAGPGRPVTYTATVTNHGPSPATGVTLAHRWDTSIRGGMRLLSFASSQGACSPAAGAGVDCQLGNLGSGDRASVTVSLRSRGTGSVTTTAAVSAAEHDSNPSNNTDSETTQVGIASSP